MSYFRRCITRLMSTQHLVKRVNNDKVRDVKRFYSDEPTEPFDNLPFRVTNRYTLTLTFAFLFGVGLWAPFLIVWYLMAKRTM